MLRKNKKDTLGKMFELDTKKSTLRYTDIGFVYSDDYVKWLESKLEAAWRRISDEL